MVLLVSWLIEYRSGVTRSRWRTHYGGNGMAEPEIANESVAREQLALLRRQNATRPEKGYYVDTSYRLVKVTREVVDEDFVEENDESNK
jgi:hypothetical protein